MARTQSFEPVHQESTAALIARQLRDAIMHGRLAPGAQLSEADLSAQFGVSRGPLREAMQRLVQEGLLRSERNRGLFVIELAEDDVRDVYAARLAIESAAATMILRSGDPVALAELRSACEAMTKAAKKKDMVGLSDADLRFHEVLVTQSGSPRLNRMHETLIVETRMCMTALQDKYHMPVDVVLEHAAIVDAIEAKDEALVLRKIDEHMQDALSRLAPAPA
ncbi:GntR family transcriptional regulator [Aeromicrobium sp.]|uniref:GntR family transcriptional regulator n=1 Tax=Aeromicrobium sp. TaxID=1871063 RepID=UPI003C42F31A